MRLQVVSPDSLTFHSRGSPVGPTAGCTGTMKLTKHLIDAIVPGNKDQFLWDSSPLGFGVRVRPTGAKTFIYSYRPGGGRSARKVRYTIGRYGTVTLEQARKEAQQL